MEAPRGRAINNPEKETLKAGAKGIPHIGKKKNAWKAPSVMGLGRLISSGELCLNCTEMVKSFPFIQVQTSSRMESIKLESRYSSEEGEELFDL